MRLLPAACAVLLFSSPLFSSAAVLGDESRLVWQPVQEYFIHVQPGKKAEPVEGKRRLNSFTAYTHLGTDFGFMGPAEHDIEWQADEIRVHLGQEPEAWSGMWHSLAGLARESQKSLNFAAAWSPLVGAKHQPRIASVRVDVSGHGKLKLEIKSDLQELLWSTSITVDEPSTRPVVLPVSPLACGKAKLLTWIAEPGSELTIERLHLGVETAGVPFDEHVLAASYAKLARSYDESSGFVKDRAHLEDGAFESVASTGLFALATGVLSQPPLQIVSPEKARATLRQIHAAVKALDRPHGVLPHFVRRGATGYVVHPGTEYSTVDTALYYHCLLLATEMLGDAELKADVVSLVDQIDFTDLRLPGGEITHGLKEDGRTLLAHGWEDWGGESALVMMLQNIVDEHAPRRKMERPGQAWQGTGFITELQSLFYPDFDSDVPDALDGVRWLTARRRMLSTQRDYITRTWPGSMAAKIGLYGLSAGEGLYGNSYHVGGTDLPDQAVIHPHYVLMSAALTEPRDTYTVLRRMEKAGLLPPWGMVEAASVNGKSYLPMNGSLNAGFETLGAYHLLARNRGIPNAIYNASRQSPELRRAVQIFYPIQEGEMPVSLSASE
ncbi:hypothetical protein [Brevifollis gellanilyticus]|uniref:hypothetical protein n=1 Tax=Brevifollis gellanilyticus TaxID=748831 RepID=UPI0011BE9C91|nr:hypothetical protein [Brevifollis gellanilyticus]